MTLSDAEVEEIKYPLRHYLKNEYRILADWNKIIQNRTEVTTGVYAYNCPCQTIYLDSTNYAVTYGKQRVTGDKYQYNFTNIDVDPEEDNGDIYGYTTSLEWKKTSIWDDV